MLNEDEMITVSLAGKHQKLCTLLIICYNRQAKIHRTGHDL